MVIPHYSPDGKKVTAISRVASIGAFENCEHITSVVIPDSVEIIERYAFQNCKSLVSVTIPESVKTIGSFSFAHCTALSELTIPEGVSHIGKGAFQNCKSLTKVTLPASVSEIELFAFWGCDAEIDFDNNENFAVVDGMLYNKELTKVICVLTGKEKTVTVAEGVTEISPDAFYASEQP